MLELVRVLKDFQAVLEIFKKEVKREATNRVARYDR